jgi:hypothetical protein
MMVLNKKKRPMNNVQKSITVGNWVISNISFILFSYFVILLIFHSIINL